MPAPLPSRKRPLTHQRCFSFARLLRNVQIRLNAPLTLAPQADHVTYLNLTAEDDSYLAILLPIAASLYLCLEPVGIMLALAARLLCLKPSP